MAGTWTDHVVSPLHVCNPRLSATSPPYLFLPQEMRVRALSPFKYSPESMRTIRFDHVDVTSKEEGSSPSPLLLRL
jgi:hypothetical protein